MNHPFVTAILLAAGKGERTGLTTPKQFLDLMGRPLLEHSLTMLDGHSQVDAVVVVLPDGHEEFWQQPPDLLNLESITTGGLKRQESLAHGLVCIPDETELVLVHDAARPLISDAYISRVVDAVVPPFIGAVGVIPVDDALKEVSLTGEVVGFRSKRLFMRAQTPQVFQRRALEDSIARMDALGQTCEDCSEMLTRSGYRVVCVEGDLWNVKVTKPFDLAFCERVLESRMRG